MHADKHQKLMAAGADVARAVLCAAIEHGVGVDDVVREALVRGDRPTEARAALASLAKDVQAKLKKMINWPWDCPVCLDAVDKIDSCNQGHLQCARCREAPCPKCHMADLELAARNARAVAQAQEKTAAA